MSAAGIIAGFKSACEEAFGAGRVHEARAPLDPATRLYAARDPDSPRRLVKWCEVSAGACRTADDSCDGLQLVYAVLQASCWVQQDDSQTGTADSSLAAAQALQRSLHSALAESWNLGGACMSCTPPSSGRIETRALDGVQCHYWETRIESIEREISLLS